MNALPTGWVETTIGEVTKPFESVDPGRSPDTWVNYIDIGSIDNGTQQIADPKRFLGRDAPSRARRRVETGDVLFSTVRTYLKNIARVPPELDGALTSTGIALLRPSEAVESSYLFHWVCSAFFLEAISKAQDGTMYPAVSDRDVSAAAIVLPPLAEQRRIVAKLDALTARTTRARADLDRIPALAARYKQAVLAKEMEGRGEETVPLSEIIESGLIGLVRSKAEQNDVSGVPYVRMQHFDLDGEWNIKDLTRVHATDAELVRFALRADDVLFNTRNSTELVGKVALCGPNQAGFLYNNNLLRLRFRTGILPEFAYRYMQSPRFRAHLEGQKSATTSVAAIYQASLYQTMFWVPPEARQAEIARRIGRAFVEIDRLTAEAASARHLLVRFDEAVLAKAFRGELVPQDPTEEPASVLLNRVKTEREAEGRKPKSRDGRKPNGSKEQTMSGKSLPPRDRILKDSESWPALGLPFEAIASRNAMPHDQLRDALFELLAGPSPALQQRFDTDAELMVIQRVAA